MTNPIVMPPIQTTRREIRRRVRRALMLRRLRREMAVGGQDADVVLRRPTAR